MPAINISVVTPGTDTLTAVAHGLLTGARFRLRNTGGALPAATPSLAGATDYFAVRTGVDTLQVATSNANALAGTPIVIDITGTGSGTNTIEYDLPYCIPNEIAVDGVSQVHAKDLNGSWNSLVALYDLLTGQAQSLWSAVTLAVSLALTAGLKLVSSSGKSVTHVAPAGLAADYTLTWPAGIPTARSPAFVDSTGAISTGKTTYYSAALAAPAASGPTFTSSPPFFNIGSSGVAVVCPIWEAVGSTITTLQALVEKTSNATFTVQAVLHDTNVAAFTRTTTLIGSNNANNPGSVNVGASGLSIAVVAGHVYELHVNESTGAPGAGLDGVIGWSVTI